MKLPKGLTLLQLCLMTSILAFVLTIYSYCQYHLVIKHQEIHLSLIQKSKLYFIRFIHYFMGIFIHLYLILTEIFLFQEILYLLFYFFLVLHWEYFGECILSIAEKQLLDNTYYCGDNAEYEPFRILIHVPPNGKLKPDIIIVILIIIRTAYAFYYKKY